MPLLPLGARRMWLRRFGKPTRRQDWAPATASIQAARMAASVASQQIEEFDIPQTEEILLCEAGALGSDAAHGTLVLHDGVLIELQNGPNPLPSDRAWEYWTVVV